MKNKWCIITSSPFDEWYDSLDDKNRENVLTKLYLLEELGPQLSRPYADTLKGSKYPNMKELRVQSHGDPLRVLYAFDPKQNAILLCAGNKKGSNEKQFYKSMISLADQVFEFHLETIKKE